MRIFYYMHQTAGRKTSQVIIHTTSSLIIIFCNAVLPVLPLTYLQHHLTNYKHSTPTTNKVERETSNKQMMQKLLVQTFAPPNTTVRREKVTWTIARTKIKMWRWCNASRESSGTLCWKKTRIMYFNGVIELYSNRNRSLYILQNQILELGCNFSVRIFKKIIQVNVCLHNIFHIAAY